MISNELQAVFEIESIRIGEEFRDLNRIPKEVENEISNLQMKLKKLEDENKLINEEKEAYNEKVKDEIRDSFKEKIENLEREKNSIFEKLIKIKKSLKKNDEALRILNEIEEIKEVDDEIIVSDLQVPKFTSLYENLYKTNYNEEKKEIDNSIHNSSNNLPGNFDSCKFFNRNIQQLIKDDKNCKEILPNMIPNPVNTLPPFSMPFQISIHPPPPLLIPSQVSIPGFPCQYLQPPLKLNPPPLLNPDSNPISKPSDSLVSKRNKFERYYLVDYDSALIIFKYNLHLNLEEKYKGHIKNDGYRRVMISHDEEKYCEEMEKEFKDLEEKFSFDENYKWSYLENDGEFRNYDDESNYIIESYYREIYYELTLDHYISYSLNVKITYYGATYYIEFAQLGEPHRQRRKNCNQDTIRLVIRQASDTNLNEHFIRKYKWFYKTKTGEYKEYDTNIASLIENSYLDYMKNNSLSIVLIPFNNRTYQICFKTMHKYNEVTRYKYKIKRVSFD